MYLVYVRMDGHTTDRRTDRHTDIQHETIIPYHYRVVGYKNVLFVCVVTIIWCWPSQPHGVMPSAVSLPKWLTSIVHILSPETDNALLESTEEREWMKKIFHDQFPWKNVADLAGVNLLIASWTRIQLSHWGWL